MARADSAPRQGRLANRLAVTGLLLRRLRVETSLVLTLIAVVFVSSFVAAGAPQLLNDMGDDGVHYAIRNDITVRRNISVEQGIKIAPPNNGDDTFSLVKDQGQRILTGWPDSMQHIIVDDQYMLRSPQYHLNTLPEAPTLPFPTFLRFRYQEELDQHIDLIDGRRPELAQSVTLDGADEPVPLIEVMMTPASLEELRMQIGDRFLLTPNDDDPLFRDVPLADLQYQVMVEIVGLFEANNEDEPYWFDDKRLLEPVIIQNPDFVEIYVESVASPDAYGQLLTIAGDALWSNNWRYFVDPELVTSDSAAGLQTDIRKVEVTAGGSGIDDPENIQFRTGLAEIIADFLRQRQLSLAILSIAAAGLSIIAILTTGLLANLLSERRKTLTVIARSRGASSGQLLTAQAIEALALAVPVSLIAWLLARFIVPGRPESTSLIAALIVGVGFAVISVVASRPLIRRELGQLLRMRVGPDSSGRQRLVFEAMVVVLAVIGLVLIRRRGVAAGNISDPEGGFDPLLAIAPVLIIVAAGLVLVRLLPLIFRFLAWLGSLRRDLALFISFHRMSEQSYASRLPIIALLAAVGIAIFSSVLSYSIERGQIESSWHLVGGDYRLQPVTDSNPLPSNIDLSGVPGFEASADVADLGSTQVRGDQPTVGVVRLLALDISAYESVVAGTPIDRNFPNAMQVPQNPAGIGTEDNPFPVVISSKWVASPPDVGDTFTMRLAANDYWFVVRDVWGRFPTIDISSAFVIMPLESLRTAIPERAWPASERFVRAADGAGPALRETLVSQTLAARMTSRDQLYSDLADAPLINGVRAGFALTVVLAAIFAALAVFTALALTAAERRRDLGYLRTLGLSSRQAALITVLEHIPVVLLAIVTGAALGIALVRLVEPGLDLALYAGEGLPTEVLVNWGTITLLLVGLLVVTLVAMAAYSLLNRRVNLGQVLRLGDDG